MANCKPHLVAVTLTACLALACSFTSPFIAGFNIDSPRHTYQIIDRNNSRACDSACYWHDQCAGYVYIFEIQTCFLKSSMDSVLNIAEANLHTVVGVKPSDQAVPALSAAATEMFKRAELEVFEDFDSPGSDMLVIPDEVDFTCYSLCLFDARCAAAVYKYEEKKCYLKAHASRTLVSMPEGMTSFIAIKPNLLTNVTIPGVDVTADS